MCYTRMMIISCKKCGEPFEQKHRRTDCPSCHRKQVYETRNARKAADPEMYYNEMFNNRLWSRFRLRRDVYDAMLERQGGACAACGGDNSAASKGWHVDHDHSCCPGARSCGQCIRGLLCAGCNVALGHVHDSIEQLRALISYLEQYAE